MANENKNRAPQPQPQRRNDYGEVKHSPTQDRGGKVQGNTTVTNTKPATPRTGGNGGNDKKDR